MDTKTVPDWNEWDFFRLGEEENFSIFRRIWVVEDDTV